jgi:ferritin-like metal-binding protein YciE
MDEKAREQVAKYVHDMHSLISHGHEAIRRQKQQLKDSPHAEAKRAVDGFEETMDQHLAMLKKRLEAMGESTTSPIQDAASTVAGVVAGVYNSVRSEEASKSVRDDYTFFGHAGMAYLMLHTTTMALGDQETARIAERGYRDTAQMMMEIDHVMPKLVVDEIRENGFAVQDVSHTCHELIRSAWQSQHSTTGRSF